MSIKLPKVIETYVNAANDGDPDKGSACFSETATVLDEGETLKGRKSIRDWMLKTKKQYSLVGIFVTAPLFTVLRTLYLEAYRPWINSDFNSSKA